METNNLNTLSILHYVYGVFIGLVGIGVLFMLLTLGQFFQSDWFLARGEEVPPPFVGVLISTIGWLVFTLLALKGAANIISGSLLARKRGRLFSQVVAAMDCLNIPFGIALGIFTLVELNKADVRDLYGSQGSLGS